MGIANSILIVLLLIAILFELKVRYFVSTHIESYNMFLHINEYELLRMLSKNSDPIISFEAKRQLKNYLIASSVIISVCIIFIVQLI